MPWLNLAHKGLSAPWWPDPGSGIGTGSHGDHDCCQGRAAITAEIGIQRISEQIDALDTMRIDPLGYGKVNDTSFRIGDYESLKEVAIDPYVAIGDVYVQYRMNMVKKASLSK